MTVDSYNEEWAERLTRDFDAAVRMATSLAKGEHSARLRGRYVKGFDAQGVHAFSQAIGAAQALVPLLGIFGIEANVDPASVWVAGRQQAEAEFVKDVRERGVDVFSEARRKA